MAGLLPPSHPGLCFLPELSRPLPFSGLFEYALDAKGRLTVPAKYRASLAGGVVLTLSAATEETGARALGIWPAAAYETFAQGVLQGMSPISPKARALQRVLYGNAFELELDSAHRLTIPSKAREYAGLSKDVVITGAGEYLEVWDKAAQESDNEALLAQFPELVASLDSVD